MDEKTENMTFCSHYLLTACSWAEEEFIHVHSGVFYFGWYWGWTQGLMVAGQEPYHWSHASVPTMGFTGVDAYTDFVLTKHIIQWLMVFDKQMRSQKAQIFQALLSAHPWKWGFCYGFPQEGWRHLPRGGGGDFLSVWPHPNTCQESALLFPLHESIAHLHFFSQ
jgi:hypothetical protein